MWTKVLQLMVSALAGWFVSDVYNEYQTSRQIPKAVVDSSKKNWLKWVIIGIGGGIILLIVSKTVTILFPKIHLIPKK